MSLLVLLAAATLESQRPGPVQQQPSRDNPAQQRLAVGTASITGRVVASDTGRPIRRARVVANSATSGGPRAAMTDAEGRYEITGLPAGQYQLTVTKSGYMTTYFGQRRAQQRVGRPVEVADGRRVENVDVALPKGGVISGHIYDEDGEPLLRAQVSVFRSSWGVSGRQFVNAGSGVTDDRGYYRVFGLMPGTYYVASYARNAEIGFAVPIVTSDPGGRVTISMRDEAQVPSAGFAPTYYPGVTTPAEASPVTVTVQQETPDINFTLRLVPTARVMGIVASPDGTAIQGAVTLTSEDAGALQLGPTLNGSIRPDGSFVINNVPPGRYMATARTSAGGRMGGPGRQAAAENWLFATQSVSVSGQDVSIALTLTRGTSLSGTITFESMGGRAGEQSRLNVSLTPLSGRAGGGGSPAGSGTFRALSSNTFAITDVPAGTYLIRVGGAGSAWGLKGIYLSGRDIADSPIEVKGTVPITGLSVVLTDQPTTITGTVADADGNPVLDAVVLLYAIDPSLWRAGTRLIQIGRPDATGAYRVRAMPPGDYYLVAVIDLEDGEWYDPAILEALRQVASRVALSEGESEFRTLRPMTLGR